MRERLAYLHVPKSAGTSHRRALLDHYPVETHVPWRLDPLLYGGHELPDGPMERMLLDEIPRPVGRDHPYRLMAGHLSLPAIEAWFDASEVATILREPRARLISQYTFWRTYPASELDYWAPYEGIHYRNLPFDEFLVHPAMFHFSDNLTVRLVVGRHPAIPLDGAIPHDRDTEVLDAARANLDRIGFVDLLERGAAAHAAFQAWVGIDLIETRENETDAHAGVPADVDGLTSVAGQLALADRCRLDLALWEHAAARVGLDEHATRRLADATYASALARVTSRAVDAWRRLDRSVGLD